MVGEITLNPDSLAQFAKVDLDAVVSWLINELLNL